MNDEPVSLMTIYDMEIFIITLFIIKVLIFSTTFLSIFYFTRKKKKTDVRLTSMLQNLDYKGTRKDAELTGNFLDKPHIHIN